MAATKNGTFFKTVKNYTLLNDYIDRPNNINELFFASIAKGASNKTNINKSVLFIKQHNRWSNQRFRT